MIIKKDIMFDISQKNTIRLFIVCAVIYIIIRLVAWSNVTLIEDHDSTFYLQIIKVYSSFDLSEINGLGVYSTPFYPFLSAIIHKIGFSLENSARFCSFIFSCILFIAFFAIGRKVAGNTESIIALFILALNPVLLPISNAILTEISYIATIYTGLLVFLLQLNKSAKVWSALLGVVFGLAFVNRTEGILFILVIPFLQGIFLVYIQGKKFNLVSYVKWCGVFALAFLVLAVPQILHVSSKMGVIALNGRIAWQLIENSDVGENSEEKQYGLFFNENITNILFARKNYKEAKILLEGRHAGSTKVNYIQRALTNTKTIIELIIEKQLGYIASVLSLVGIVGLYLSGRRIETVLILGFVLSNLIGPLLHSDEIYERHILSIVPAIILFQATGIASVTRIILNINSTRFVNATNLVIIFLFSSLLYGVKPLYRSAFNRTIANYEYSIEEIQRPLNIIREYADERLERKPIIAARKNYIAYYSGATKLYLPYTDYPGLLRYLKANSADMLYLKYSLIEDYPFLKDFRNEGYSLDFELLYSGRDSQGGKVELYRLLTKHG